jgi:hypothetical protein
LYLLPLYKYSIKNSLLKQVFGAPFKVILKNLCLPHIDIALRSVKLYNIDNLTTLLVVGSSFIFPGSELSRCFASIRKSG